MLSSNSVSNPNHSLSCWLAKIESKWIDAALIVGAIAFLIIGILVYSNIFHFIGTTNARYLSYTLYGGCILLGITELIKLSYCANSIKYSLHLSTLVNDFRQLNNAIILDTPEPLSQSEVEKLKEQTEKYARTCYSSARHSAFSGPGSKEDRILEKEILNSL